MLLSQVNTPVVISMDVHPPESFESQYRLRFGDRIKYMTIEPGTYDMDILSFPPDLLLNLPQLPEGEWTTARVHRPVKDLSNVSVEVSDTLLDEVACPWHPNLVEVTSLTSICKPKTRVEVVQYGSIKAVAKIARFEYEIPNLENETTIYEAIDDCGIGPAFLGHLTESGRVMGILLEKLEGPYAEVGDLEACRSIVTSLHSLGIVHGDLNKYNFIMSPNGIRLIDFEHAKLNSTQAEMDEELGGLESQLKDDSGRGAEEDD